MKMYLQSIHMCITFFFCVAFTLGNTAYAQNLDAIYTHTASQAYEVLDTADIFTPEEELQIKEKLKNIEENTTAEGAVISIPSTNGQTIAEVALNIGRQWGIGKADTSNGFVMIIAVDDRQWFISTGDGLEGTIPDLRAYHVGTEHFTTNFRNNKYATGVLKALDDIALLIEADPDIVSKYEQKESSDIYAFWIFLAVMIGFTKTNLFVLSGPKKQYFLRSFASTALIALALGGLTLLAIGIGFLILYWPIELASIYSDKFHGDKDDFFGGFGNWSSGSGGGFGSGGFGGGGFGGGGFSGGGGGGSW